MRSTGFKRICGAAAGIAVALGIAARPGAEVPHAATANDSLQMSRSDSLQPREAQPTPAPGDMTSKSHPMQPGAVIPPPCPLCTGEPGVPVVKMTIESARRIGNAYADSNLANLARLDSLLGAGVFGPPKDPKSRKQAHLLARLLSLNAYSYMTRFGADRDTVWEADEATLRPAFDTFSDPGIVPLLHLSRARMGLGHMCAEYDLSQKIRTETTIGGRRLAVRIDDVTIRGQKVRALVMDLPTSLDDVVEVWLLEHICMDVEHVTIPGPPAPYEAFIISSMRGMWVRKAGLHRPEAFVFWVTPRDWQRTAMPATPLVGARIYVPHLKLKLPSVIPDIGFEDLRAVDLPQPILPIEYLRNKRYPDWLRAAEVRGFRDWDGLGGTPPAIRKRFPDL